MIYKLSGYLGIYCGLLALASMAMNSGIWQ